MPFDGLLGHDEALGDGCVGEALSDQLQDLQLSCRQRRVRCGRSFECCEERELLQGYGAARELARGAVERILGLAEFGDVLDNTDETDRSSASSTITSP